MPFLGFAVFCKIWRIGGSDEEMRCGLFRALGVFPLAIVHGALSCYPFRRLPRVPREVLVCVEDFAVDGEILAGPHG